MASEPCRRAQLDDAPPDEQVVGTVRQLPVGLIRTRFASLRPGRLPSPGTTLADGPVRVVPTDDGHYEVLDGFKLFERWRQTGRATVCAIVERPLTAIEHKRLMLVANAPPRTITALDEARIVASLIADDHLTVRSVAQLLGKRPHWVIRRHELATRLSARACEELATGRIGPSAAYARIHHLLAGRTGRPSQRRDFRSGAGSDASLLGLGARQEPSSRLLIGISPFDRRGEPLGIPPF